MGGTLKIVNVQLYIIPVNVQLISTEPRIERNILVKGSGAATNRIGENG